MSFYIWFLICLLFSFVQNFKALVDKIDYNLNKLKPIELLADKRLEFVDYNDLIIYQVCNKHFYLFII